MHLQLAIDMENAAFEDDAGRAELARIFRGLAERFEDDAPAYGTVRDSNGNAVGAFLIVEDRAALDGSADQ